MNPRRTLAGAVAGPLLLVSVAFLATPAVSAAQTLAGMVAEQGSLRPAADAVVSLLRVSPGGEVEPAGTTVADEEGVFAFAVPGPGRYRVQAEYEGLSSPLSEEVQLGEGERFDQVALLVPSRLLLMAYSCQQDQEVTGAAVVGIVRDPAGDIVLPGARVRVRWVVGNSFQEMSTEADGSGRFRLCNVPVGGFVQFRGEALGRMGGWSDVEVPRPSVILHDIDVSLGARLATGEAPTVIQERILLEAAARGLGDLRGEVLDQFTGTPVRQAVVRLQGTGFQGVTDDEGLFLFPDLPPDVYTLEIQHLGYSVRSDQVEVPPARDVFLRFRVAPQAIEVAGVEVTVRSAVEEITRLTPFRRDIVYGETMLQEELRGATAVDILRRSVPGLRVVEEYLPGGGRQVCISTNRRVGSLQTGTGCDQAQIVINGVRTPEVGESLSRLSAAEIESIEFLPPAQAQTMYGTSGNTANGVIVIWTRGRGPYVSPLRNAGGRP